MKIVVAPDSFKETLSAKKVGEAIKEGLTKANHTWDIRVCPIADGGEGTVEALVDATEGKVIDVEVLDPLMRKITASYGILGDGSTAVIEMAAASGLELLEIDERFATETTSYGTGQLILNALERGINNFIIGIGGSATTDGGVGMLQALGASFKSATGEEIGTGGGYLKNLNRIDLSQMDSRLINSYFRIACDVNNPLTGPEGAAMVYGPQKGANTAEIEVLDQGLSVYADVVKKSRNKNIDQVPGAGAAGGLGAAFIGFLNSELKNGGQIIFETLGIKDHIAQADLVITGEGGINHQTVNGKAPIQIADISSSYDIPVIAICGSVLPGYEKAYERGISAVFSSILEPGTLKDIKQKTEQNLKVTAENIGRLLNMKWL